jgi:hypothetical protein
MTDTHMVPTSISALRGFYTAPHAGYVMDSVMSGNTFADAFSDNADRPSTCVVWDGEHSLYLADGFGQPDRERAVRFVCDQILTPAVRNKARVLKIHYVGQLWPAILQTVFPPSSFRILKRKLFQHRLQSLKEPVQLNLDFRIQPITDSILHNSQVKNIQGLIDEIRQMWGEMEPFLKSGFGYCATDGNVLASWCTIEYLSSRYCGIGVDTAEPYRRRGLSTACAEAVLRRCLAQNLTPYWDSWSHNVPSIGAAEKLGFDLAEEYECIFVTFPS